jgi:hypothetical protein
VENINNLEEIRRIYETIEIFDFSEEIFELKKKILL